MQLIILLAYLNIQFEIYSKLLLVNILMQVF